MIADIPTALYLESNNTKLTTTGNSVGTMIADIPTALSLESNKMKHTTPGNTIGTMRKELDIDEFLKKLEEYETYFWTAKTKADNETKLEELKLLVLTTDYDVIQKAFEVLIDHGYTKLSIIMIMFHILLITSVAEPPIMMIQLIQKLSDWEMVSLSIYEYDKYFNIFYQGLTPSEVIHTIHDVWKSCSVIEFALQITYCDRLLQKKEYKNVKYLVTTKMKFFASCLVVYSGNIKSFMLFRRMTVCTATFTVMMYVLHCSFFSNRKPDIRETIVSIVSYIKNMSAPYFNEGLYHYLMLLNKDQMPCTKHLIHQLLHAEEPNQGCTISAIIKASVKLLENNYYYRSKHFLHQNLENLKDIDINMCNLDRQTREGYSQILSLVLHECCLSKDTYGTELAVAAIGSLKLNVLDKTCMAEYECSCYMNNRNYFIPRGLGRPIIGSEYFCDYSHLKRRNKGSEYCKYSNYFRGYIDYFVILLKRWNDNLNKCTNKGQQIDNKMDWLNPDADYNFHKISAILRHVADDCKTANKLKEFVQTLCQIEFNPEMEDLCTEAITNSVYIKFRHHNYIAQFVLDINKVKPECSLLTKLTLTVGKCLHFGKKVIKDKKKVLYKCFCKVRNAVNNGDHKDINIDEYLEHFTFIRSMEEEKEMEKLIKFTEFFIMVMLLLMGSTYGGHHKSAEMKKYLSLKYEYDKAILYLLWCSGDVEINPGPTLSKLKSVPASQKLRAWVWDMCSILLKILKGIPVNSKPKDLWKDKPNNWPCDQPFYDPRNMSKGSNEDVKSDDSLLKCILHLCSQLDISQYQMEITAWRDDDKTLLFELHTCRKEIQTINTAIQCLINVKDTAELQHMLGHIKIQIDFSVHSVNNEKQKGTTDIIRGVAVIFCKISLKLHPMEKTDGIWRTEPTGWKKASRFYDPNNAGKRTDKGQDKNLVNDLVEYIETHDIVIPQEYAALVTAWKHQNMQELCKIYTLYTNVAVIENALQYLKLEGLLYNPYILDKLKHNGLTLCPEWLNGYRAIVGICDGTQASTSHKGTYVDQSNAQQNSANLNSKGGNGSQHGPNDNAMYAPSHRKRSNITYCIQEAEEKCQNKKRKLLHDENTTMKTTRQKHSSSNASRSDTQNTLQPRDHHSLPPIPEIDYVLQELDQNYGSVESQMEQPGDIVAQDIHTISVPTEGHSDGIVAQDNHTISVPTEGQSDGIVAQDNHTISVPTEGQSDGIVAQDNHTISVPTEGQSDGIVAQDNHTISVPTEGQSDGIVAQDCHTIVLPSGGQSGDMVNQNNKTIYVPSEEQAVDTVTQDNHTISVPIGEQHDAIYSQDNKTASKSNDNKTDVESSENTENDELLNKIFACHPDASMKCDDLDSQLIKDMDQLVWWINDKNSNV